MTFDELQLNIMKECPEYALDWYQRHYRFYFDEGISEGHLCPNCKKRYTINRALGGLCSFCEQIHADVAGIL